MASTFEALILAQNAFLLNPPIAVLTQNTVQSIATGGSGTPITFDGSIEDSYSAHSTVTNNSRYTAQVAGWYVFTGTVAFASNSTGVRVAEFAKNGTAVSYTQEWAANTGANPWSETASFMVQMIVGDYVELWGYQTSGGALNTMITGPQSSMYVYYKHQ